MAVKRFEPNKLTKVSVATETESFTNVYFDTLIKNQIYVGPINPLSQVPGLTDGAIWRNNTTNPHSWSMLVNGIWVSMLASTTQHGLLRNTDLVKLNALNNGTSAQYLRGDLTWQTFPIGSTTVTGIVRLNNATNSTSTTQAATANAVKVVSDSVSTHANTTSLHLPGLGTTAQYLRGDRTWQTFPIGSTTVAGILQLNNATNSTSTTQAATANAVSLVNNNANTKLPFSGGTMTGTIDSVASSIVIGRATAGGAIRGYLYHDASGFGFLTNSGGWAARVDLGTANLTVTGNVNAASFNSASSIRFKTDVKKIEQASELIKTIEGVTFKWKTTGRTDLGFIAEELTKVVPDAVRFDENDEPISVNYSAIIPILVEGFKEQQSKIDLILEHLGLTNE